MIGLSETSPLRSNSCTSFSSCYLLDFLQDNAHHCHQLQRSKDNDSSTQNDVLLENRISPIKTYAHYQTDSQPVVNQSHYNTIIILFISFIFIVIIFIIIILFYSFFLQPVFTSISLLYIDFLNYYSCINLLIYINNFKYSNYNGK